MRPIQSVSVLIPTYQGMEFLDRLMGGLAEQDLELEWDVYAIDSSSSDGTWEALEAWGEKLPVKLARERITSVEFDHGDEPGRPVGAGKPTRFRAPPSKTDAV